MLSIQYRNHPSLTSAGSLTKPFNSYVMCIKHKSGDSEVSPLDSNLVRLVSDKSHNHAVEIEEEHN